LLYRIKVHRSRKGERRSFAETDYAALLDAAHQYLKAPIVVVWDNLNVHLSAAMRDLVANGSPMRPAHAAKRRSRSADVGLTPDRALLPRSTRIGDRATVSRSMKATYSLSGNGPSTVDLLVWSIRQSCTDTGPDRLRPVRQGNVPAGESACCQRCNVLCRLQEALCPHQSH
jgi:hypothetical protein